MSAEEHEKLSASEKKKEDWMNSKWRPAMGWIYMVTCITDFILFPVFWAVIQTVAKQPITPWQPLTLQGAGLYHVAMGAIIGIAAFGRTQEKIAGANVGGATVPGPMNMPPPLMGPVGSSPIPPMPGPVAPPPPPPPRPVL